MTGKLIIEIEQLKSVIQTKDREITFMQKQYQEGSFKLMGENQDLKQQLKMTTEENYKLKNLLKEKDLEIERLS